jgi:hypothetical protein
MGRKNIHGVYRSDFESEKDYLREWQRAFRKTAVGQAHVRRMNLKKKGITPEEYDALLLKQDNKCAVCRSENPGRNQRGVVSFAVDHCHDTGKIRGLLCMNCNRAEGLLKGNAQALADYLKDHAN